MKQPLKYYHFGSAAPSTGTCVDKLGKTEPASFCDGASANYGVDERAEVGLISRNIKLTSIVPEDDPTSLHWGGEIMIHKGFGEASIQGVEVEKFGKDQLGSYPIHFHQAGDITSQKPLIDANSVHHSYNKCVSIHSTQNLKISNTVCARIVGHIFYQEMGDEYGTAFEDDLALGAMSNNFDINGVTQALPPNPSTMSRDDLVAAYWWIGDYLTNNDPLAPPPNGYDGFNIPNTGDQTLPVTGGCDIYDPAKNGGLLLQDYPRDHSDKKCRSDQIYSEPSSGFWVINPTTVLKGNAVAGCQGAGKGFYWVTPNSEIPYDGVLPFTRVCNGGDKSGSMCTTQSDCPGGAGPRQSPPPSADDWRRSEARRTERRQSRGLEARIDADAWRCVHFVRRNRGLRRHRCAAAGSAVLRMECRV